MLAEHKKSELAGRQYDISHDKGTYDTISLSPENAEAKRQQYIKEVYKLTKDQGLFIITSCNWTEEELISHVSDCKCMLFFNQVIYQIVFEMQSFSLQNHYKA